MIWSLLALALAGATWFWYLALIPSERVPARPVAQATLMVGALVLAIFGVVQGLGSVFVAGGAIVLAGYFFYLLTISALPPGELTVSVGDRLPTLTAVSDTGVTIDSGSWQGRRVMLKVFRGGW